jgi:hypothetical protein
MPRPVDGFYALLDIKLLALSGSDACVATKGDLSGIASRDVGVAPTVVPFYSAVLPSPNISDKLVSPDKKPSPLYSISHDKSTTLSGSLRYFL